MNELAKKKRKLTQEEKEWIAHEEGWDEGYNAGIVDFEAVEREKEKLRKKGFTIVGDKKDAENEKSV